MISENEVSDTNTLLESVAKLGSLKNLHLDNLGIKNISSLSQIKNLELLEIVNNKISDLTPLKDLPVSFQSLQCLYYLLRK